MDINRQIRKKYPTTKYLYYLTTNFLPSLFYWTMYFTIFRHSEVLKKKKNVRASISSLFRLTNSPLLSIFFYASCTHFLCFSLCSASSSPPRIIATFANSQPENFAILGNHWFARCTESLRICVNKRYWNVTDYTDSERTRHWHATDMCESKLFT